MLSMATKAKINLVSYSVQENKEYEDYTEPTRSLVYYSGL